MAEKAKKSEEEKNGKTLRRTIGGAIGIIFLGYVILMIYFSGMPEQFKVEEKEPAERGAVFVTVLMRLMEQELNSDGGWLPNDIIVSPGWWIDNRPNFQLGVLETVRYSSRVLKENLSRSRTTDKIDEDASRAFEYFSNDAYKWWLPSAEGKFEKGIEALKSFETRLSLTDSAKTAQFYPRSDNLIQLLTDYASLLGGINTRLMNAGGGDVFSLQQRSSSKANKELSWFKVDDEFYYGLGVGYGINHMMKAVSIDFSEVIEDKNAEVIINEIIYSLDQSFFNPLIVHNGSKGGLFANHPNNLRVFLDNARQKMNSLISILDKG